MTLDSTKCKFGLIQVEYVGHMIYEKGMSFSEEEKLRQVLEFSKPSNHHGMEVSWNRQTTSERSHSRL
jgi:hypothetical protein